MLVTKYQHPTPSQEKPHLTLYSLNKIDLVSLSTLPTNVRSTTEVQYCFTQRKS